MSEQRFNTPNPVSLELKLAAGDVRVETVDGGESIVTLQGSARAVEQARVELIGDRLVVAEVRKGFMGILAGMGEPLEVRIQIPHHSQVDATTAAADVHLHGTFAGASMTSASGALEVVGDLEGDADIKTASGSVRVPHVGGSLRVKCVSGDVTADAVDGSISVKSVSGGLNVGSVREGKVDVHTVSGDVTIGVAPGTSVDVDAGTASGDLSSDIPLSGDAPQSGDTPAVVIRVNTVSGDLRVRRAA